MRKTLTAFFYATHTHQGMLQLSHLADNEQVIDVAEGRFVNASFAGNGSGKMAEFFQLAPDYTASELESDILALLDRSTTALCWQEIRRGLHQHRPGLTKKLINSVLHQMKRRGLVQKSQDGSDVYWRRWSAL